MKTSKRSGFGGRKVRFVPASSVQEIQAQESRLRAGLQAEIQGLRAGSEVRALQAALEATGPGIMARDQEIQDLRAEVGRLTDQVVVLNGRAECAEHAERSLKARIEELRGQRDHAKAEVRAMADRIKAALT